jgi:hypothetical protein
MRFYLSIFVVCFIAIGCNSDPRCRRETALLRAEILDIEDKYYLLKSQRDAAIAELNADGKTDLAQRIFPQVYLDDAGTTYENGVIYDDDMIYDGVPFDDSPANTIPIDAPENRIPRESIESVPSQDSIPSPDSIFGTSNSRRQRRAPESNLAKSGAARSSTLVKTNSANTGVTGITIHRGETRGQDIDGKPGDEGLRVLIQPKSASGETLLEPGQLTVSVIDPDATSANQRIGLWKFLPEETALFFTEGSSPTDGILLNLPWDQATPRGKQVVVFARFQTEDGQRWETSAPIRITPWTEKTPDSAPVDGKQSLIADWKNQDPSSRPGTNNDRQTMPVKAASTGTSRISKPTWRPVR